MNLSEIIKKSFEKRESFFKSADDNSFRLFNSSGDGLEGLTVDYYAGHILVQNFSAGGSSTSVVKIASKEAANCGLEVKSLLLKDRTRLSADDDIAEKRRSVIVEGFVPDDGVVVRHMGLNVLVDPVNAQNTGLFMDMRDVRAKMSAFYPEFKSLLNLFSYTCVFSLHALKCGVASCVNVDISRPVLNRGKANYELNGFVPDDRDFIKDRSDKMIKYYMKKGASFSLSVIDPPTFARSRSASFSVTKDFRSHLSCLSEISDYVLSSTNNYSLSEKEFFSMHPREYEMVFSAAEASDFPYLSAPYLKCALWKIRR